MNAGHETKEETVKMGVNFIGVCVVFACHDGEGNFLFAKRGQNSRDEKGTWDPGGGGLEFGDTVEDTLRKEIMEEYCAEVLSFEFMGFRDVHREHEGKKTHWIALDHKVRINPVQVKNGEPHKLDEIAWFTLDELPDPTHSQWPFFLKKYRSKLEERPDAKRD
jgi:8-oxo-dGTP diphosphatase